LGQHFSEVASRLCIAVRAASSHILTPGFDFPWGPFVCAIFVDPGQNLAIAFAARQLLSQSLGIDPGKICEVLIKWTIIMVFSGLAGNLRPPFIQHPGQKNVSTESLSGTARWTLG